ncbi:hypothetical protein [Actinopolyspora halophila]|uniref:hypothetical protein n=1 Tax=Actinopolyspora halophila TaxID=1850 RepID=UPI00038260D6|nr:hypothetical protein [Actinopolyspora halophila]
MNVGNLVATLTLNDSKFRSGIRAANASMSTLAGMSANSARNVAALGATGSALGAAFTLGGAGAVAAVAGIGIAVAAQNEAIKNSFSDLGEHISESMSQAVEPLVPVIQTFADQFRAMFDRLLPVFESTFSAMAPVLEQSIGPMISALEPFLAALGPIIENMLPAFQAAIQALGPILSGLAGFLTPISETVGEMAGQFMGPLASALGAILPALGQLVSAFMEMAGPALGELMPALTKLVTTVLTSLAEQLPTLTPVLTDLVDQFSRFVDFVTPLIPPLISLVGTLAPFAPALIMVAAAIKTITVVMRIWTAVQWALNVAMNANPIGIIITAVAALVAAFIWAWQNFEGFRQFWKTLWAGIKTAFSAVWDWLVSAVKNYVQYALDVFGWFGRLPGMIGGFFSDMVSAIGDWINNAIDWVAGLPGRILDALGDLGSLLWDAGKNVIQGLIDGIQNMIGNLGDIMGNVAGKIRDFLPFSPAKEGPLSGSGNPEKSGQKIGSMLSAGMQSELDRVQASASLLAGGVSGGINRGQPQPSASGPSVDDMAEAMGRAIDGRALDITKRSGKPVAELVNKANARNARR